MERLDTYKLLREVAGQKISPEEAALKLKMAPFEELGFAKPDMHRGIRQGVFEVIYGAGKTADQIRGICDSMQKNGQSSILITRLIKRLNSNNRNF